MFSMLNFFHADDPTQVIELKFRMCTGFAKVMAWASF